MIEKLKWFGWIVAAGLLVILLFQRSWVKSQKSTAFSIHDTIKIRGDSQLYIVQDTILKPYKIYYRDSIQKLDTDDIIKNYFSSRMYYDTIKARNVTTVIKDSMSENKIASRKVWIENSRDLHLTTLETKPTTKFFIGGFIGVSQVDYRSVAGLSLAIATKKNILYLYDFDIVSKTHTFGICYQLPF